MGMTERETDSSSPVEAKRLIEALAPGLRSAVFSATVDPPEVRTDMLALVEAALVLVEGERGGWCPECEAEGKDPRHKRTTILCGRHWRRAYAKTEEGQQAAERYKSRQHERRSPMRVAYLSTKGDEPTDEAS